MNFEIFSIFFWNLFYVSTSNFKSGKPNSNFLSPENWPHIFKSRKSEKPCMEHSAKKLGKIASKHVQNTFGHFWKRLWSFLEFLKFFDFFWNCSKPDPPWNTGQLFFRKKSHKSCSKQVWTFLGTILGFSAILNFFWFFRKLSMTPWNTGQKKFRKNCPKTRLDTWERFWTFLELWIFSHFFLEIFPSLYLKI